MTLDPNPIPEPSNADQTLLPPTELEATTSNSKCGYSTTFDCPDFHGQREVPIAKKRKHRRTCKLSPTRQCNQNDLRREIRTQGGPNPLFLQKFNLDQLSHPADWINALLPLTLLDNLINNVNITGDGKTKFYVANWTTYTYTKAMLSTAGQFGHPFPN